MINLEIDTNTNDLIPRFNNLAVVTGSAAVAQLCESRLSVFEGEFFLDRSTGLPYLQSIFKKETDRALIDSFFKNVILSVDQVTKILSYYAEFIGAERKYSVTFDALLEDGSSTGETTFTAEV